MYPLEFILLKKLLRALLKSFSSTRLDDVFKRIQGIQLDAKIPLNLYFLL